MKEIVSLIERARKYLNSSRILLDESDYESKEILDKSKDFVENIVQYLKRRGIL